MLKHFWSSHSFCAMLIIIEKRQPICPLGKNRYQKQKIFNFYFFSLFLDKLAINTIIKLASAFRYFFWFDSIPIYRQHFSNSSSMLLAYTFYSFSTFFLNIIQFIKFPLQNYLSINFFLYSVIIAHDKLLLKES